MSKRGHHPPVVDPLALTVFASQSVAPLIASVPRSSRERLAPEDEDALSASGEEGTVDALEQSTDWTMNRRRRRLAKAIVRRAQKAKARREKGGAR